MRPLCYTRGIVLLAGALLAAGSLLAIAAEDTAPEVPPLRRVLIPPDRVPAELERVKQGVLLQLPRAEFEERYQKARAMSKAQKNPPRLVEASYRAILIDNALANGTAQWRILNPSAVPGILNLQPLNVALRNTRLQNADAILGDLDGKTPGLLIDTAGESTALFDWTARGLPAPDGIHFDLRLPAAPVAALELRVPADRVVAARDNALVSGPHPAESADLRLWRVEFGGQAQVELTVRRPTRSDQGAPLVLAQVVTRQDIEPDVIRADFDIDLEVPHQPVREFLFECDPGLHPYEVSLRSGIATLENWEIRSEEAGKPVLVALSLREPFHETNLPLKVQIRCWADLPRDRIWKCSEVRAVGAILRGERVQVRIHPDVRLENWQSGSFAFVADPETSLPGVTPRPRPASPDAWQLLTLTNNGITLGTQKARPSARVVTPPPDFRARQAAWWQVGPRGASLTCWITYEVEYGQLFRLPVALPPDWQVDRVTTEPGDLLRNSAAFKDGGRSTLVAELNHPLAPVAAGRPATAQLRLELTPTTPWSLPAGGGSFAIPAVNPLGAHVREGVLGVSVDPLLRAELRASASPAAPSEIGPWGNQVPDHLVAYRGLPVVGALQLRPQRTQFRARLNTEVALRPEGALLSTDVIVIPGAGAPSTIEIYVPNSGNGTWNWQGEQARAALRSVQRQATVDAASYWRSLGATNPLLALVRFGAPVAGGEIWQLVLAQPLREPLRIHGTLQLPQVAGRNGDGLTWYVPCPCVLGADPLDGEVTVQGNEVEIADVKTQGAVEPAGADGNRRSAWRAFRYHATAPTSLLIHGKKSLAAASNTGAGRPLIDRAALVTTVEPSGRMLGELSFRVWNWRQSFLPLRLGAGARPLAMTVDGRWSSLEVAAPGDGDNIVQVPIPAGPDAHQVTLVYEWSVPAWKLWTKLDVPLPGLPVEPLELRRRWRLPAGIAPLARDQFDLLPGCGPGEAPPGPAWLTRRAGRDLAEDVAELAPVLSPAQLGPLAGQWRDEQRVLMEDVFAGLTTEARHHPNWTLGDSLDFAVREPLRGSRRLVVDAVALRTEGLAPTTALSLASIASPLALTRSPSTATSFQPWEQLGLVYVPCPHAPLLTTVRQLRSWGAALPADVEEAVASAATSGHDCSGRFRTAIDWLASESQGRAESDVPQSLVEPGADWNEWEPIAGHGVDGITIVRRQPVAALGLFLTALLAALAWRAARWRTGARVALLLVWLGGSGAALLWLPSGLRDLAWYPLLGGIGVAILAYLGNISRQARGTAAATTAAVLLFAFAGLVPGQGEGSNAVTVLIVNGSDDAPEKQTVLVPPQLLRQLDQVSLRGVAGLREPVILSASYEGNAVGTQAEIKAEYRVRCFRDPTSVLNLPISNAQPSEPLQLKEALRDGAAAFPDALRPPQLGYAIKLEGRGLHVVTLRFSVPTGTGAERNVRVNIPEVNQTHVQFETPAGSRYLHSVVGRGRQTINPELAPNAPADRPLHLDVDLGRNTLLHLRWRSEGREPQPARVAVREAYLWKLHPAASSLFAVYQFSVRQGAPTTLAVDVPDTLEIRSLTAGRLPEADAAETLPRLKDWHLANPGGPRRLVMEFQRPLARGAQVSLELVPRQALGSNVALPLPVPHDARTSDGYVALQVEKLQAQVAEHVRVIGLAARAFIRVWDEAGMPDPGTALNAYSFQRAAGAPVLRVNLAPAPNDAECTQKVTWHLVNTRQADVTFAARVRSPSQPVTMLECVVPANLQDVEVSGADVRTWSQAGGRVQVWLSRSTPQIDLRLSGWQPVEIVAPIKGETAPLARLRLAPLGVVGARTTTSYVYVTGSSGIFIRAEETHNLALLPTSNLAERRLGFVTTQSDYGGTFLAREKPVQADASLLTFAELREHDFDFTATIDFPARTGEPRIVTVRLNNWENGELRLEAPPGMQHRELPRDKNRRAWSLTVPAQEQRVRLVGRVPLQIASSIAMPDIRVEGLAHVDRWVAVAGRELRPDELTGLASVPDVVAALRAWPAEAERVRRAGTAWKVQADNWRLRLLPRSASLQATPSRVLLSDHSAAVVDGQHWLHETVYWIYHEADNDLRITLPEGAKLQSLAIDNAGVAPAAPGQNAGIFGSQSMTVWLPRSRLSGARALRIRWTYEHDRESVDRPNLALPQLDGMADGPAQWTAHVPAGYHASSVGKTAAGASAVELDLRRADAMFRLSGLLAEQSRNQVDVTGQLAAVQEGFYRYGHRVDLRRDQQTGARMDELRAHNLQLARAHGFEPLRKQAEERSRSSVSAGEGDRITLAFPAERGTPTYWRAENTQQIPSLRLASPHAQSEYRAREGTLLLVVVLGVIVLFVWFPRLGAAARLFWPETMMLAGCAAWQFIGPGWLGVFLVLLGVIGRAIIVLAWLASLRGKPVSSAPSTVTRKSANVH
jgi:hypothetical protein